MLPFSLDTGNPCDDSTVVPRPVTDQLIRQINTDLEDALRNDLAADQPTAEELADMEAAALAIDLASCEYGLGKLWCPRCGFGCCSIVADPNDRTHHVCAGGCDVHGRHPLTVRVKPEHRSIRHTTDAIGRINPADAAAFLAHVADRHGQSDFLAIDPAGHVTIKPGSGHFPVEPSEARALGEYLHEFLSTHPLTSVVTLAGDASPETIAALGEFISEHAA